MIPRNDQGVKTAVRTLQKVLGTGWLGQNFRMRRSATLRLRE
jgi:hypothetical protein